MKAAGYPLLLFFYDERQCPHLLALGKEKYDMLPCMFYRLGDVNMGGGNRPSFFFLYERGDVIGADSRKKRALFVCLCGKRELCAGERAERLTRLLCEHGILRAGCFCACDCFRRRLLRLSAKEQKIPRVAVGDIFHFIFPTDSPHIFLKDY